MSVIDRLKRSVTDRVFDKSIAPTVVDNEVYRAVMDSMPTGPMVRARPQKDGHGLEAGPDLIETLYMLRTGRFGVRNYSPRHAFELWYDDGKIQFRYYAGHDQLRGRFESQLTDKYPGTAVEPDTQMFPQINEGDFVAGAQMNLRKAFWYPIKVPNGVETFDRDPYGALTSEMVVGDERTPSGETIRSEDARVLIQVLFRPAKRSWSQGEGLGKLFGVDCESKGQELKNGRIKGGIGREMAGEVKIQDASRKLKQAGELISKQRGEPGFYARIRVLAISPYKEVARRRARSVTEVMETYYNAVTEQGLTTQPVRGDELTAMLERMACRQLDFSTLGKISANKTLLTAPEVAALAHLPASAEESQRGISTSNIDWTFAQTSPGLPPDMPSFEPAADGGDARR